MSRVFVSRAGISREQAAQIGEQRLTGDHVSFPRAFRVVVDFERDFLFTHEEREVKHVLDRLRERMRVDDEPQVRYAFLAGDGLETFRDL